METSELLNIENIEFSWKFKADHKGYYMVAVKHVSDKRIVAYKPIGCTPIEWLEKNISQVPRGWKRVEAVIIDNIIYDIQKNKEILKNA